MRVKDDGGRSGLQLFCVSKMQDFSNSAQMFRTVGAFRMRSCGTGGGGGKSEEVDVGENGGGLVSPVGKGGGCWERGRRCEGEAGDSGSGGRGKVSPNKRIRLRVGSRSNSLEGSVGCGGSGSGSGGGVSGDGDSGSGGGGDGVSDSGGGCVDGSGGAGGAIMCPGWGGPCLRGNKREARGRGRARRALCGKCQKDEVRGRVIPSSRDTAINSAASTVVDVPVIVASTGAVEYHIDVSVMYSFALDRCTLVAPSGFSRSGIGAKLRVCIDLDGYMSSLR